MPADLHVVDSSVWILALKKNSFPPVKDRVSRLLHEAKIATVGIIKLELLGGTA